MEAPRKRSKMFLMPRIRKMLPPSKESQSGRSNSRRTSSNGKTPKSRERRMRRKQKEKRRTQPGTRSRAKQMDLKESTRKHRRCLRTGKTRRSGPKRTPTGRSMTRSSEIKLLKSKRDSRLGTRRRVSSRTKTRTRRAESKRLLTSELVRRRPLPPRRGAKPLQLPS